MLLNVKRFFFRWRPPQQNYSVGTAFGIFILTSFFPPSQNWGDEKMKRKSWDLSKFWNFPLSSSSSNFWLLRYIGNAKYEEPFGPKLAKVGHPISQVMSQSSSSSFSFNKKKISQVGNRLPVNKEKTSCVFKMNDIFNPWHCPWNISFDVIP